MKFKYIKSIVSAALFLSLTTGITSCINDLDISPIDPQMTATFDQDMYFTKLYASLGLTGQKLSEDPDIAVKDEGQSCFYRALFTNNEYGTDEMIWTWQENAGIPELTYMRWNSSHQQTEILYNRLAYNITLCNFFLDQIAGKEDATSVQQRAEARFLRSLFYYYLMDTFGKAPFTEHFSKENPPQKTASELFAYIESELESIENDMSEPRQAPFGRADKAACWSLRARLYLNAEVYTGQPRWNDAITYAGKVLDPSNGYGLCGNYEQLFMADNDENPDAKKEIILSIRQDGVQAKSYGGSYFLIAATQKSDMPNRGTNDPWECIRTRKALVDKFFANSEDIPFTEYTDNKWQNVRDVQAAAKDERALFYTTGRKAELESVGKFTDGLSFMKWSNLRSDGQPAHDAKIPDTDIPFFRLAEAYLIRAEAYLRAGGANAQQNAWLDIKALRDRAKATEIPSANNLTLDYILDERARELYLEGFRRTDLIRYGYFTSSTYLWDWKGGSFEGNGVSSIYNLYPIPKTETLTNTNMTQNPGY